MTQPGAFMRRLCAAVLDCNGGDAAARSLIGRAIADTAAVAAAGFSEPVTQSALRVYRGDVAATWSGEKCDSIESAIFVNGAAAHALDFDDVFLDSTTHPSAVILPAIFDAQNPAAPDELIAAFGAGLIAARAIAKRVGLGHYHKGWHATGTLGAFAAAAAAARLRKLNEAQLRAAFALAAAQSGGLKINFGSMAKPAHAGFAAAAGVRAVRLAQAGVDGSADIFAPGAGYADLYGTGDGVAEPNDDAFALRPDRLSLKLYACCYATHRLIGVALDARRALGDGVFANGARARLTSPEGTLDILRNDNPATALEAKFSAKYTVATTLADGAPSLAVFTDDAVRRPGLGELLTRVTVEDDATQQSRGDIEMGEVRLEIVSARGDKLGQFARRSIPGSPDAPPERDALLEKTADCLRVFSSHSGRAFPILAALSRNPAVNHWLAR